jgi:putative effector of murein hydrolase LrgA (UPF0299 family)
MQALTGFTLLLIFQALGEVLVRVFNLPLPGPVAGMVCLIPALYWARLRHTVKAAAEFLLNNLSLLFVPVGVGVMTHLDLLSEFGLRIGFILVVSSVVGIAVTAWLLGHTGQTSHVGHTKEDEHV